MWNYIVCLLVTCCLVEVKASPDISLDNVLERLVVLEDWKRETEHEVASLKLTVAQQEITIKNLQRELARQTNLTAELQTCVRDNAQEDQRTEVDDTENDTEISKIATTPQLHNNKNQPGISKNVKREIVGGVAFSAFLDHDVNPGTKQTVKFNQIITNDGAGYNNYTGVFTCPESGFYLFSFFVGERSEADHSSQMVAELVVNSQIIAGAIVETMHIHQDMQGGNMVVVRLNRGDAVWVDAMTSGHIEGSAQRFSTFTGVYLYG